MAIQRNIQKDDGYGPYLLLLKWIASDSTEHYAVFSEVSEMESFRAKLKKNLLATMLDLAVDHTTVVTDSGRKETA